MYNDPLLVKALQKPAYAAKMLRRKVQHGIQDTLRFRIRRVGDIEIVNQIEICMVGLRRSGNHAIINWIRQQQSGRFFRINDVPVNENPFRYKHEYFIDHYPEHAKAAEQFRQESLGKFSQKDCLVYNYEDRELNRIFSPQFQQKRKLYVGKSAATYNLLILRDPFNLLASRFKKGGIFLRAKSTRKTVVDLWIEYAKEFLGETSRIPEPKICLNYNQWTADKEYRRQIAAQLGLEFSDEGIEQVHSQAGGSSFDGVSLDGQANQMDVQNRWKHFAEHPQYRQQLDNDQLLAYSERIFGVIEGTESLRSIGSKR